MSAGGITGLFARGGWQSLAALRYITDSQRSSLEAMEFAVNFSDEE
jgi:hypothetical protein